MQLILSRTGATWLTVHPTYLLWLIKYGVEVPKATASREFSKDFAEQLLWVHMAGLSAPVLLPSSSLPRLEASRTIRVILLPLYLITKHL